MNSINRGEPMSGRKKGAFTHDLDISKIKKFCKMKNCTINDYYTAQFSAVFYEYFEKYPEDSNGKKLAVPKEINFGMPVSMRQPFETLNDVRMINEFCPIPVTMPIRKTIDEALPIFVK
jgi:hypothetical protein